MAEYVKCPRCDLNYMLKGEEYCDVCKAELKKGPTLIFAIDGMLPISLYFGIWNCVETYIELLSKIRGYISFQPINIVDVNLYN